MKNYNNETKKILKGFPPHIQAQYGFNVDKPTFFGIHMEPICNFKCRKCFIGEQKKLYDVQPTLTMEEIKSIMKNAYNAGVKVMGITGAGEPLLDPRIKEIISESNRLGFITIIPTNASVLTKELLEFLRDNNVTLSLSFDSTNCNTFTSLTGTNRQVFEKVLANVKMAQEVYANTMKEVIVNGQKVLLHRIAIHMTIQNENKDDIEEVRKIVKADTLFSLSPLAQTGFAQNTKKPKTSEELNKDLTEKHIVICYDNEHSCDVCGFFKYGIDMNFDGQLLLDAHAIETRHIFKNIRDFKYDITAAYREAVEYKNEFIENWIDGFCPVRSAKLNDWINEKRGITK